MSRTVFENMPGMTESVWPGSSTEAPKFGKGDAAEELKYACEQRTAGQHATPMHVTVRLHHCPREFRRCARIHVYLTCIGRNRDERRIMEMAPEQSLKQTRDAFEVERGRLVRTPTVAPGFLLFGLRFRGDP